MNSGFISFYSVYHILNFPEVTRTRMDWMGESLDQCVEDACGDSCSSRDMDMCDQVCSRSTPFQLFSFMSIAIWEVESIFHSTLESTTSSFSLLQITAVHSTYLFFKYLTFLDFLRSHLNANKSLAF